MRFTLSEVLRATAGRHLSGPLDREFRGVATDSRTLREGELFVALKGPRHDGHDYLEDALRAGAAGAVVARGPVPEGLAAVVVPDTLKALGDLGRLARHKAGLRVIAVTGSAGKTTTKELASALVRAAGLPVLTSPGNWNNRVGVPLSLLRATGDEAVAVLELGVSEPGEMADLSRIAEPDVAVITNVAPCHTEGLGGLEGVIREKMQIVRGLRPGGVLVLPHGDPRLSPPKGVRTVTFGWEPGADVRGEDYAPRGLQGCVFRAEGKEIRLPLPGRHNALNALAALAAVQALGAAVKAPEEAWAGVRLPRLRAEVRTTRSGVRLLVDCYNANPRAVEAALETLAELAGGARKVAVLGEMRELGALCREGHEAVGRAAVRYGVDELHLLGPATVSVREAATQAGLPPDRVWMYEDREALAAALGRVLRPGDWVLIKGSRALGLEAVAEALES